MSESEAIHRVYVDRIDAGRAVLIIGANGDVTASIPSSLLPSGCKEGTALDLSFTLASGDTTRTEIGNLMDELFES